MISAGVYGYPKDQALEVAVSTIRAFLEDHEMDVILVIFDRDSFRFDTDLYSDISGYLRQTYAEEPRSAPLLGDVAKTVAFEGSAGAGTRRSIFSRSKRTAKANCESAAREVLDEEAAPQEVMEEASALDKDLPVMGMQAEAMYCASAMAKEVPVQASAPDDLAAALKNLDESFSQALLRMIDSKGMKDSECYKKANIDRKLFSKIRSDINYRPSKQTVLAFAVALELDLPETEAFLRKAGFALSHSNKADVIVEYFIANKNYDMYRINEALFAFDQNLLGA